MTTENKTQGSGIDTNVASCLCYLCGLITGIVFLIIEKENKDVKYHALQAIFLNIAIMVLFVGMSILSAIPFVGWLFGFFLWLPSVGWFVLTIICMVKAYQGEKFKIPVVSDMAAQQVK